MRIHKQFYGSKRKWREAERQARLRWKVRRMQMDEALEKYFREKDLKVASAAQELCKCRELGDLMPMEKEPCG